MVKSVFKRVYDFSTCSYYFVVEVGRWHLFNTKWEWIGFVLICNEFNHVVLSLLSSLIHYLLLPSTVPHDRDDMYVVSNKKLTTNE